MPEQTFGWQTLCEAAILETNPDKLAICIGAAEQAIAQRESLVDTELERHKLADARFVLPDNFGNPCPPKQPAASSQQFRRYGRNTVHTLSNLNRVSGILLGKLPPCPLPRQYQTSRTRKTRVSVTT